MTVQVKHLLGIEFLHRPAGLWGLIKVPLSRKHQYLGPKYSYLFQFYGCCFANIGHTHIPTLITSALVIITLVVIKEVIDPRTRPKIKIPIPGELIVVSFLGFFCPNRAEAELKSAKFERSSSQPSSTPFRPFWITTMSLSSARFPPGKCWALQSTGHSKVLGTPKYWALQSTGQGSVHCHGSNATLPYTCQNEGPDFRVQARR